MVYAILLVFINGKMKVTGHIVKNVLICEVDM